MADELKGAAYHEAGHAVTSHVLGERTFTLITIEPNDQCEGRVQYEPMPDWFQPEYDMTPRKEALIRAEVVSFFAGACAQGFIDGPSEAEESSYGDYTKAANLASYAVGEHELGAYLKGSAQEAERLVDLHRPAIDALAGALLTKRTLTGDEARAIIGSNLKLAGELEE